MVEESADKWIKRQQNLRKNSNKALPRLLVFFNKIEKVEQFDDYLKNNIALPLLEWFMEVFILRAFLIYLVLAALTLTQQLRYYHPSTRLILAQGLSILWFLVVNLKQDLWRKQ